MENIERITIKGKRHYRVTVDGVHIGTFPSVTSVIWATKEPSPTLDRWKKRVGEKEAHLIMREAGDRGTVMHKIIEVYMQDVGVLPAYLPAYIAKHDSALAKIDGSLKQRGLSLFQQLWDHRLEYFQRIDAPLHSELFLWRKEGCVGYAGTVDCIARMKSGAIKIIDFKTSTKFKRREWVEDYFIQVAAYARAYEGMSGVTIDGGEVWIAVEEANSPQLYEIKKDDINHYYDVFLKKLTKFSQET